jgi:hypothetical protein
MGFSDHTIHNISLIPDSYTNTRKLITSDKDEIDESDGKVPDQELLESVEAIYFKENVNMERFEINVSN